ncbi:MAG: alpha/beta hydrolase [Actinomycetota bacterium]
MLERGGLDSSLVPGPVAYATLRAGSGPASELPILLWLHGGGGSERFLSSCRSHFVRCWREKSLPDLIAVTPAAGWSFYLDRRDGSEQWEQFLLHELVPHIRRETGSTDGPLLVGGISVGAVAALRLAFKRPDLVSAVAAVEPTMEAAFNAEDVPLRDQVQMPGAIRRRLFGDPIDPDYWRANHPPALALDNAAEVVAAEVAIYVECGDQDQLHAHYGTELLHRQLFDGGIPHEYRLVRGGEHVGPTVGPRIADSLRFLGRTLKPDPEADTSFHAIVELENFAAQVTDLEQKTGYRRRSRVQGRHCPLDITVTGEGPTMVMLPSLGRGAADFDDLGRRLARAGYQAVAMEPRGITGSSASLDGLGMEQFADDVAHVIDAVGGPAVLIGHDFGAQLAQLVSDLYPRLVSSLVLLAPPGPMPAKPEPATALRRVFIPELSDHEHLEAVALALFAEGNDPVVWVDGWYPTLAFAQAEAERHLPPEDLWERLRCDVLVVHGADDLIAVPENARMLGEQVGEQATVVTVPDAAHALLPEQPAAVAAAILSWVRGRH